MPDSNKQTLADRMKEYEANFDYKIMRRCPVILRLDGRSFSRLTKSLEKPSEKFINAMANTTLDVAKDIEGCVFGYCQSDEITLVLKNDQSIYSMPWFDNRIQKMVSIAAAEATYAFGKNLEKQELELKRGIFDCRVFSVPNTIELVNNLIYRQRDCMRNAISLVADAQLRKRLGKGAALKLLLNKGSKERLQLLFEKCGIDFWKDYPSAVIRGVGAYRKPEEKIGKDNVPIIRNSWVLDYNIPEFDKDAALIIKAYEFVEKEK